MRHPKKGTSARRRRGGGAGYSFRRKPPRLACDAAGGFRSRFGRRGPPSSGQQERLKRLLRLPQVLRPGQFHAGKEEEENEKEEREKKTDARCLGSDSPAEQAGHSLSQGRSLRWRGRWPAARRASWAEGKTSRSGAKAGSTPVDGSCVFRDILGRVAHVGRTLDGVAATLYTGDSWGRVVEVRGRVC